MSVSLAEAGAVERTGRTSQERRAIAAIGIGLFLGALDGAIIATALPRIAADLGVVDSGWSWLAASYVFGSAISVPAWGAIGDARGHRHVLACGLWLLLVSSLLCALAGSEALGLPASYGVAELTVWRFAQGIGSGAVFTGAFALIAEMFPLRRRARHAGRFALVFAVATLAGPLLGGLITDGLTTEVAGVTVAGWRFIFILQLPVAVLALALAGPAGMQATRRVRERFDFAGLAAIVALILCLTVSVTRQGEWLSALPWLGGAAVAAAALAWIEGAARRPLLPPPLLADRSVRNAALAGSACSAALLCLAIAVPGVLQLHAHYSPTETGFAMAALSAGIAAGALAGGRWLGRTGDCRTVAATAIVVALAALVFVAMESGSEIGLICVTMGLVGLGLGPLQSVFGIVAQHAAPPERRGAATALIQFSRRLGATGGAFAGGLLLTAVGKSPASGLGADASPNFPLLGASIVCALFLLAGLAAALAMQPERLPDE